MLLTGCRTILDIIGSKKQRVVIEEKERLDFPAFSRAWTIPDIEMAFAPIESGKFIMGSLNQIDRNSNPWHYVTLSKPFWMSRYEVTQEQYTRVVEYNPARFLGDHNPVEQVIWRDAEQFCKILTVLETKNNRIPDG